jgi:RNAse (barnase) inhibitor barstar
MNTQTINDKDFAQSETVYEYLLRTYDVKDDMTSCTLWEMVKNGLFSQLMEEKNLLPF